LRRVPEHVMQVEDAAHLLEPFVEQLLRLWRERIWQGRQSRKAPVTRFLSHQATRANLPRPNSLSLASSVAFSRSDVILPMMSSAFFTAGRSAIVLNQRAMLGWSASVTPQASRLRVQGKVAMSAIEYSAPPRNAVAPSRFSIT